MNPSQPVSTSEVPVPSAKLDIHVNLIRSAQGEALVQLLTNVGLVTTSLVMDWQTALVVASALERQANEAKSKLILPGAPAPSAA